MTVTFTRNLSREFFSSLKRHFVRNMAETATFKSPREIRIPVPWGEIRGSSWGNPDGKRVLALHGWLDNAGTFSSLIPLLSDDLNIVAIDLPGHGQSSHRPIGCRYNFVDYLADVKRVVDGLGWKEFMLMGHSMGASVSSWFAAALPEMVKGLLAIEGFGVYSKPVEDIPVLMGKALLDMDEPVDKKVYPTWESAVERLKEGHIYDPEMTIEAAELLCKRGTIKLDDGEGYKFTRDLRLKQRSILYATDELNGAILGRISCPTLVIIAENTFLHPDTINKRLDNVKRAELVHVVRVPGGHHTHLCNPQNISSLVNSFLQSLTIPPDYQVLSRL